MRRTSASASPFIADAARAHFNSPISHPKGCKTIVQAAGWFNQLLGLNGIAPCLIMKSQAVFPPLNGAKMLELESNPSFREISAYPRQPLALA